MSSNDKWWLGFITLWIVLCAGKPDILDGITTRLIGDPNKNEKFLKCEVSLGEHKARENTLVKVLHQNQILTDKEFFEMTAKSLE